MFTPIALNLPPYPLKLRSEKGQVYVFDELRKRHLVVTPEEWVRQHWIQHLINVKQVPRSLIQSEGGLTLNSLKKRTDLVIFSRQGQRLAIAEFKAPSVKISQNAFDQIARYNIVHKVPFLLVSNGLSHYYCRIDFNNSSYQFIQDFPLFTELSL